MTTESADGFTVTELAERLGGQLVGDGSARMEGIGDLKIAGPTQVAFVRDAQFFDAARGASAGVLLVPSEIGCEMPQIIVDSPDIAFAKVANLFHPVRVATEQSIDPSAVVHPSARIEEPVEIAACAVVEAGASIGAGSIIHSGAIVRRGSKVGRDCVIHPRVVLYPGVTLGDRVILHSGVIIGGDGFGYAPDPDGWVKVPQLGTVRIEDDVEIGPNCAVDRGTLGTTRIAKGVKIDNLCHIAHNCDIGEHVVIAGLSAISGSVKIGDRSTIGGHVVMGGHIQIPADSEIGGASILTRGPRERGRYMGYPLMKLSDWGKVLTMLPRLPGLFRRVRELEKHARDAD